MNITKILLTFVFFISAPSYLNAKSFIIENNERLTFEDIDNLTPFDLKSSNLNDDDLNQIVKDIVSSDLISNLDIKIDNEYYYLIIDESIFVNQIFINGNIKLQNADILQNISIKNKSYINENNIQFVSQAINNLYSSVGQENVLVSFYLEKYNEFSYNLVFEISENLEKYVNNISIIGNKFISNKFIKSLISIKEKKFFSFMSNSNFLNENKIYNTVLKISNNYNLNKVKISIVYQGKFEKFSIEDEESNISFSISPNDGKLNLVGYSNNAGEVLAARNITKDIVGGNLFIKGKYNSHDDYELILTVNNFEIKKKTKFETLIKSTRFFDLVSIVENSQNSFSRMEVPMKKKDNLIYINDAFIEGGLVGFTFAGIYDAKNKITNIDGFYGPLYLFDKYVDDIPLLNKILTNKKNESLLGANFSVKKVNAETSVTINPLSLVTPGKTKRIFKIFDFLKKDKNFNQE